MEFNQPFSLPAVFGAETAAAEDENHGMLSLQFGELPAFRNVVGKLIVGKDSSGNDVRSHRKITRTANMIATNPSTQFPRTESSGAL